MREDDTTYEIRKAQAMPDGRLQTLEVVATINRTIAVIETLERNLTAGDRTAGITYYRNP